jgi:pectin methylesterase-like acyl-CoA thioesterase
MKTISLKPLLAAFAVGRSFTYTTYVTGASVIAATSFGEIIISELKSPWAIAVQIAMIAGLVALGSVDWKNRLKR